MKNMVKIAALLGVYGLIGGMGYYHLVVIHNMRHHTTAQAKVNSPLTVSE